MVTVRKRFITIGLIALLAVALCAGPAYAYFTAVTSASGEQEITLGYSTETHEELANGNKKITMKNTGDMDVMVRVIIMGAEPREGVDISIAGLGWSRVGGSDDQQIWLYTADALHPGEETSVLNVEVEKKEISDKPIDLLNLDFDIAVVGQCTPAAYDDSGKAYSYTDWK